MQIHFSKYHGTGNDFIIIDNREQNIILNTQQIAQLCHRRFGIGADGLMLLEAAPGFDFRMVYYNADGRESSMCGNGGRCIAAFAQRLGIIQNKASFIATDGSHEATIDNEGIVTLRMQDVTEIEQRDGYFFLDTGSPHYVQLVDDVASFPVVARGREIRYDTRFAPGGVNVNFAQRMPDGSLNVRTYERGVEDETMSCGTGVTACAIAVGSGGCVKIGTPGGNLEVGFEQKDEGSFAQVYLKGTATYVYEGVCDKAV